MAPYVYKKISSATVTAFHETWKRPNATPIEWKTGPYMRSIKLGNVTVTHWGENGTLMLQGPEEPTERLNEDFLA